jgi:anti-sigma-K factor RskA
MCISEQQPALRADRVDCMPAPDLFVLEPSPELWCAWGGRRGYESSAAERANRRALSLARTGLWRPPAVAASDQACDLLP